MNEQTKMLLGQYVNDLAVELAKENVVLSTWTGNRFFNISLQMGKDEPFVEVESTSEYEAYHTLTRVLIRSGLIRFKELYTKGE